MDCSKPIFKITSLFNDLDNEEVKQVKKEEIIKKQDAKEEEKDDLKEEDVFKLIARNLKSQFENNIFAQVSFVMLIGMAAKNAILIVEFANDEFKKGLSLFDAAIHVLHVQPANSVNLVEENDTKKELIKQAKNEKIEFTITQSDHIAEAVETFAQQEKADLLVMFTHKLDFYEKLFGRGVTRELAFHGHVPLLTFNKTTLQ